MAYSCDAFPKDYRETSMRQERDGAKPDGLTQTNEIASKREMELSLMA